jgi:uncharacterized protein YjbI with pentapeptide repeats
LEAASLWQANLRDANLSCADLRRAKLDHAGLSGANLRNADVTEALLWGAQLSGSCVEHAVGLTEGQLKNAHLDWFQSLQAQLGSRHGSPPPERRLAASRTARDLAFCIVKEGNRREELQAIWSNAQTGTFHWFH